MRPPKPLSSFIVHLCLETLSGKSAVIIDIVEAISGQFDLSLPLHCWVNDTQREGSPILLQISPL